MQYSISIFAIKLLVWYTLSSYWSDKNIMKTLPWRHNEHDSVSNHQPHDCLLNCLFGRRSKKVSKLRVTGLCAGNSPGTGEFPAQRASNTENVSIWWRHHERATNCPHIVAAILHFGFVKTTEVKSAVEIQYASFCLSDKQFVADTLFCMYIKYYEISALDRAFVQSTGLFLNNAPLHDKTGQCIVIRSKTVADKTGAKIPGEQIHGRVLLSVSRNHSVYVPSQWETVLQYSAISHWLGAYTKWSLVRISQHAIN